MPSMATSISKHVFHPGEQLQDFKLKRLPGDPAWLRDRNQYESYQRRHTRGGDAR